MSTTPKNDGVKTPKTWQGSYRATFQFCGPRHFRLICHDPVKVKSWGHPPECVGHIYECQVFGGACSSHTCRKGNGLK